MAKKIPVKKKPSRQKSSATKKEVNNPFPVVAIGSSAGGLEAVSELFRALPSNLGMAFIYVQHLSPNHKSLLTSILSHVTDMKVQEIENMEKIVVNNVYVIPNNKKIEVTDGHIKLLPRLKGGTPISVDILFESLAETHKENVVGIILSGNGSDGKKGLEAIKKMGGVTMAQDASAQSGGMPKASIDSGIVDFVLSPKGIARKLIQLSKGKSLGKLKTVEPEYTIEDGDPGLKSILEILHREIKVDFSRYKMATIKRRISHRMQHSNVKTIKEYVKLLIKKKSEVNTLYKEFLINVTNFYRDAETFKYLKTNCLPKLLKSKLPGETLRIWIPACSTGEEVYSIAILIAELQENKKYKIPVQIFASDLSDQAINEARIGDYSKENIRSISKKRLDKYFTKIGDNYRISKNLREMCIFAAHNILRDPPFSHIDFISCRNLLIYFDAAAQKRTLGIISFALNDGGYLLLGKSETIGASTQYFNVISSKYKLYTRKINQGVRKLPESISQQKKEEGNAKSISPIIKKTLSESNSEMDSAIDATLLSSYMPACAIINKDLDILKFRGATSLFLSHSSGNATLNILKMARPEFAFELRNAIEEVIKTNKSVLKSGLELSVDKKETKKRIISFEVSPLATEMDEPLFLIVFTSLELSEHPIEHYLEHPTEKSKTNTKKDLQIKRQIEELHRVSAEMLIVIQSQEKSLEELQVANEEIVSVSEEYQTLNEELETSKEEIEATNEELQTTNQELQVRNEQLAESYNFS